MLVKRKPAPSRLLYIDNLRILLTILVVVSHLAIGYGADTSWYYLERPVDGLSAMVLKMFVAFAQWFAMGLFFLIAGFFVEEALERKGTRLFVRDRLIRLGIPLLLFEALLSLPLEYIRATQGGSWEGGFGTYVLSHAAYLPARAGPMWFVEALLALTILYALGHGAGEQDRAVAPPGHQGSPDSHTRLVFRRRIGLDHLRNPACVQSGR